VDTLDGSAGPGGETVRGEEAEAPPERGPAHYKTGNLNERQAAAVDAWRARLRQNRPLPGQERASDAARLAEGASDHPRASTSDVIAAAVADMLRRRSTRPAPLDLAAYAYRTMIAARAASWDREPPVPPPDYPAVSWYAPPELADQVDELRAAAAAAALQKANALPAEAAKRYPADRYPNDADRRRARYVAAARDRYGLRYAGRAVPPGAVARMAIDRWAARDVDQVIAAGVAWCQDHHQQWHRPRRDMRALRSGPGEAKPR
jgi:hypothetical protein